jgi:RNA polymerase sigma-70 factor (ECF subfamily)
MHASNDADILEACRRGDRSAFNQLVRRHQDRVYGVIKRLVGDPDDAWDISQDVFIRAYEKVADFRGDSQVFTWLYRIAVNLSLNHLRSARMRRFFSLDDTQQTLPDTNPLPSADVELRETRDLVKTAIERLPAKQKAVFILRYYEELPYEDISAMLKTSVGGLKANYHHAVRKIEAHVRKQL